MVTKEWALVGGMFSLGGNVVPVWTSVGDGLIGKEKSDD